MAKERLSKLQRWILILFYVHKEKVVPIKKIVSGCYCAGMPGEAPATKCKDIASLRVVVSRALRSLRDKGLITIQGTWVIVSNDETFKLGAKFFNVKK